MSIVDYRSNHCLIFEYTDAKSQLSTKVNSGRVYHIYTTPNLLSRTTQEQYSTLMASSRGMKPFVTKFHGKTKLTSTEFMAIFRKYDKDGELFFVWLQTLHISSVNPAAAGE